MQKWIEILKIRQFKVTAFGLACCALVGFASRVQAQGQVEVEISRIGDATNVKFKGLQQWKYLLKKQKGGGVILRIPPLETPAVAALQTHTDPLIKSIVVHRDGVDGTHEIEFKLTSDKVDAFDYLTDQPAQLVVDFYTETKKKTADEEEEEIPEVVVHKDAPEVNQGQPARLPEKKTSTPRKPAGDFIQVKDIKGLPAGALVPQEDVKRGIFDGGDPQFRRFSIEEFEMKEDSLIASRGNLYIQFPMLKLELPHLGALLKSQPTYEIVPQEAKENEEARLLLTLFQNKRRAVFLKTAKQFLKDYPESKYDEIVRYMMADMYYDLWRVDSTVGDLETAMGMYRHLSEKYPNSPLNTRTLLLMGFTYLDRKDSFSALKTFQRFLRLKPDSKFRDQVKVAMAESYLNLNKHADGLTLLEEIEKTGRNKKDVYDAAFRKGDVFFQQKDMDQAIKTYQDASKKFGNASKAYPNAYYNLAEAQFILDKYKEALNSYRVYLENFPDHPHGGYAMTRIGEILEILGADQNRVIGAYKESYFRYRETQGAKISRIRLLTSRMSDMKEKEIKSMVTEIKEMTERMELPEISEFVTLLITDGYTRRGEYEKATQDLIKFYQQNPHLSNKEKFVSRIVRSITSNIRTNVDKKNFIEALRLNSLYAESWLKNSDRIDTRFLVGKAYEQSGVLKEASNIYRDTLNRLYAIKGTKLEKERNIFEILPKPAQINLRLAAIASAERDYVGAQDYLKAIKDEETLSEEEQIERAELSADVAEARGQVEPAKKYLGDLIDAWKGQPSLVTSLQLRLARLQMDTKDLRAAETNLTKIIHMQGDTGLVPEDVHARALELKGDLLLARGRRSQAVKTYKDLLTTYESKRPLSSVRYKTGKALFEEGDLKDAEVVWGELKDERDGVWRKLADEQMQSAKWRSDYKKYINRIPAMSEMRR